MAVQREYTGTAPADRRSLDVPRATLQSLQHRVAIGGLCALALGLAAAPAHAQSTPFVAWEAPAECPDGEAFRRAVFRHLGAEPALPLHVEVRIERRGRRFHLAMHTTSAEGTGDRSLTGRDCAVLVETAALTLALAIEPRKEGAENPPPRELEAPPVPNARAPRLVTFGPQVGREEGLEIAARGFLSADLGSFPGLAPGAGAALSTELGRLRIEARGAYWFERAARLDADPDDGAHLATLAAGLRGCWQVAGRVIHAALCAGGELSRTTARGFGGFDSRSVTSTWIALGGGPSVGLKLLNRFTFRVDLEVIARPRSRPVFAFDNVDPAGEPFVVHRGAWVGGRASAGLEVTFR